MPEGLDERIAMLEADPHWHEHLEEIESERLEELEREWREQLAYERGEYCPPRYW
jgi:hypothetical protein